MENHPTRVLIVEGDADESSIIGTYLAEAADHAEKFALTLAPRISSARRLLGQQDFDVVLLDLVLPQSVGLEGFHQLRAMKPSLPIIILTGLQDVPLAVQAVKLGAADYFIKGTPDCCLIKRAIRYALERKRLTGAVEGLLGADDEPKIVLDSDGVVRYANAAGLTCLGGTRETIVGKPFTHPLPEGDKESAVQCSGPSGKILSLRVRPITWNGAAARLISLREPASSEQLKRLQAEIKEGLRVMEVKNHFMHQISHELRNTLSTMTTAAFCLKDGIAGTLTPRQTRLVDMIARNVERQTKIIENILDLARFQSGKLKIQARPMDLGAIIMQIVEECGLVGTTAKLSVSIDESLPALHGDPELIGQVLRNLLDNALRFAKDAVVVEASPAGPDAVRISVVDDGAGIPPARLGELFTEFVQLDRSAVPASGANGYKGTGLGLTICKEIIEGHRGRIWADNAPGRGARFSFTLPMRSRAETHPLEDDRVFVAAKRTAAPVPAAAEESHTTVTNR